MGYNRFYPLVVDATAADGTDIADTNTTLSTSDADLRFGDSLGNSDDYQTRVSWSSNGMILVHINDDNTAYDLTSSIIQAQFTLTVTATDPTHGTTASASIVIRETWTSS